MRHCLWLLLALGSISALGFGCESNRDIVLTRKNMHNHAALAQLYYDKGRYTQCMGQARRALAIDDSFVKPHCILGFTHLQVGRMTPNLPLRIEHFEKAERELIAAISHGSETNSYVFKCYFGLGLLYFQWAKAVDAIREEQGSQDKSGLPPPIPGEEKIWQE